MMLVIFKNRPREDLDAKTYQELSLRLLDIASGIPGFVSTELFSNPRGESIVIATFESAEAEEQWRKHADHVVAQGRRQEFYQDYSVRVCTIDREYAWQADSA